MTTPKQSSYILYHLPKIDDNDDDDDNGDDDDDVELPGVPAYPK